MREVIPTEIIPARKGIATEWPRGKRSLDGIEFEGAAGKTWSLQHLVQATSTDALLVAHQGKLIHEWYAQDEIEFQPHIVFFSQ